MSWIVNNLGSLITTIAVFLGVVAVWVGYGADIRQLKKDRDAADKRFDDFEKEVRQHIQDATRHIDPYRDEKRWDEFKSDLFRRFDVIERKIERLMLVQPPS